MFMARRITAVVLTMAACLAVLPLAFAAQKDDSRYLDVYVSDNSFHAGNDANPRDIGLPVYPGAHLKLDEKQDKNAANLALFTSAFGFKLLVLSYTSDDSADKIISFYREKLKKYGNVIECHNSDSGDDPHIDADAKEDSGKSKELKCDGDNKGDNIELKAGTEDNQHAVAIHPNKSGNGATFALVYVHVRGKKADI
jgi:hypothetical protein